jgi:hypothetical protein
MERDLGLIVRVMPLNMQTLQGRRRMVVYEIRF